MNKTLKYSILLIIAVACIYMIWSSASQPGINSLKGDFKEVGFYRNENNTGPITRIYSVSTNDTLWGEMQKYAEFMPHNKNGNTKVYFFSGSGHVPEELVPGRVNFDPRYNANCLGKYEKNNIGHTSFVKFPFKNEGRN